MVERALTLSLDFFEAESLTHASLTDFLGCQSCSSHHMDDSLESPFGFFTNLWPDFMQNDG